jgi:hypothetical protein
LNNTEIAKAKGFALPASLYSISALVLMSTAIASGQEGDKWYHI